MRMQCVKLTLIIAAVFSVHCGNTGIYDDALTVYARVVRPGLNEWYPLNGNLSSRIGSIDGTATAQYTAGTNRAGESGKAICTTNSRFDFAQNTFGASPFTISAWVLFNSLTVGPNIILQRNTLSTFTQGFIVSQSSSTSWPMSFGNGSTSQNATAPGISANTWYFLALSYDGSIGTFYAGTYGGGVATVSPTPTAGVYVQSINAFQIFANVVNACADDILHYNRALSSAEVQQNFLSVE